MSCVRFTEFYATILFLRKSYFAEPLQLVNRELVCRFSFYLTRNTHRNKHLIYAVANTGFSVSGWQQWYECTQDTTIVYSSGAVILGNHERGGHQPARERGRITSTLQPTSASYSYVHITYMQTCMCVYIPP